MDEVQSLLSTYGYGIEITGVFDDQTSVVAKAFQLHFRQRKIDGLADLSTVRTLRRLLAAS